MGEGETVDIDVDADGNIKNIHGMPKDSYVIIGDTRYTAPFDEAALTFDEDGWYFEGYTLPAYTVRIDKDGNISVDTGIRFRNVITSGKTLGSDGKIELSGERGDSSVSIENESEIALNVSESDGSAIAENLSATEAVTFSPEGVTVKDLSDAEGAKITLKEGQKLTDGETTVTAEGATEATVGEAGKALTVTGSAQIEAPAETDLTLGAAEYEVNGATFTSVGTTHATTTAKGVELDLGNSDALTYDGMTLSGAGEAIIESDGVTLTGGAEATNTEGKALTVEGKVLLDEKTVNTAEATEVTATAEGLNVGETELTVGGDGDGYQINIEQGDITGLENIGSASGVTVGGLNDASIHTDKASPLTVGDKTFMTNDNSVTWIDEGEITGAEEVNGLVSGDFSDGLNINGTRVQVTSGKGSNVSVSGNDEGVTGVLTSSADEYTINGKTYETSGRTTFVMEGGKVTGAQMTNGLLAIGQNETDFGVNDESLTLSRNSKPVTLGVIDGAVSEVYGIDGAISGLSDATVYDLTKATVNGVPLDVSGTTYDAAVEGGTVARISGLSSPATINSAPDMEVVTGENGTYTFDSGTYNLTDTVDSSVTFTTDTQSNLTGINDFAGSVSGAVTSLNLNGKAFGTNDGNVTVASNGTNITRIEGVKNGDSIGGDLDSASFFMPEGNITVNGGRFTIEDDEDGAQASSGGKVVTGLAKDASLTVGTDGSYRVNGKSARASVGSVFTVNRDGSYLVNPEHLPIIEKTPANVVRQRGGDGLELVESDASIGAGKDSVVVRNNAQATVEASGEPLIVATSGSVTLQNYADGNASIGTFEYTNIGSAIRRNSIQFGDGVMTLGDAVITFDEEARSIGSTRAQLVNAQGKEQAIGFTHTAGGTINASSESAGLVLKGNYAEKNSDTQKSGGSELTGGSGNDMLLIGAGDSANGGAGNDNIYVTDGKLRNAGAVIYLSAGKDTVHHFNGGYGAASDKIIISDINAIEFEASNSSLVMKSGDAQLTFRNMAKSTDLVTSSDMAASADIASNFKTDGSYRLQLQDGNKTYNAAVAQSGKNIGVTDGDAANVFYGKNSGINFSEYTGAVSVNLNEGAGNIGSQAAQIHGINKLKGGAGSSTLLGAADVSNTLMAGTGDGQIWSNSGKDMLIGNTSADKTGTTTFKYLEGDGQDTITGFEFGSEGDMIDITTANAVTSVSLKGANVLLTINGSDTDYLTLAQGKGKDFKINNLVAKVDDRNLEFDGEANCYVAQGNNATLKVSETAEAAQVWLNDADTGRHGTYYLGDIRIVDGSKSAGNLILTGDATNNTIIGGSGTNSIWGGYGYDSDVLTGGSGQNTFFFALVNGNDVIQGAHDGDVIDLGTLTTADIAGTAISSGGTAIALTDGSLLDVRSNAAIEYKTADGTYVADHASGQWIKK